MGSSDYLPFSGFCSAILRDGWRCAAVRAECTGRINTEVPLRTSGEFLRMRWGPRKIIIKRKSLGLAALLLTLSYL